MDENKMTTVDSHDTNYIEVSFHYIKSLLEQNVCTKLQWSYNQWTNIGVDNCQTSHLSVKRCELKLAIKANVVVNIS